MNHEYSLRLHCKELVEVRSLKEILATLDKDGTLEGLPFMPEMTKHCGKQYRVYKRADRTCCPPYKARGMNNTVWLENVRCDGSAHDSCGARCAFFWKEAWLKRGTDNAPSTENVAEKENLTAPTKARDETTGRYLCQASELPKATYHMGIGGNIRTYLMDLWYGNLSFLEAAKTIFYWLRGKVPVRTKGQKCGPLYGTLDKTPSESLNLQVGELVEVKSPGEIAATLNRLSQNRGLAWQPEMLEFCGKRFRVLARLDHVINEINGEMIHSKNTVLLDGVTCDGVCRRGCGRRGYTYWREIWLKRVN